jgi:hypothetical protein
MFSELEASIFSRVVFNNEGHISLRTGPLLHLFHDFKTFSIWILMHENTPRQMCTVGWQTYKLNVVIFKGFYDR